MRKIIKVISETMFVFGIVVFWYVAGVSYFQPSWLDKQVTHLQEGIAWLDFIRNDNLGIMAFLVSLIGFIIMRWLSIKE